MINNVLNLTSSLIAGKTSARIKGIMRQIGGGSLILPFQFNPLTHNENLSTKFVGISAPGSDKPVYQYVSGNSKTKTLELFLNDYTGVKVKTYIEFFKSFHPSSLGGNLMFSMNKKPPQLQIIYGAQIDTFIVEETNINIVEISPTTTLPTRAHITLKLKEV